MNVSRRGFLVGSAALVAGGCATVAKGGVDPNLSVFRTEPGRAVAELRQSDFFFPSPPGPGKWSPDARLSVWDDIVAENRGQTMHWRW